MRGQNKPGGYWIASIDPAAVQQALVGEVDAGHLRRAAVLTDGGARAISFKLIDLDAFMETLETVARRRSWLPCEPPKLPTQALRDGSAT